MQSIWKRGNEGMKAVIFTEPGIIDSIKTIEMPVPEPNEKQIQIAVKAVSLSVGDFKSFMEYSENGKVSVAAKVLCAANKPFGGDIAGIVTKVGQRVKKVKVGDEVYASIGINGGCTEYVVADESKVCLKPKNLSFEDSAAIPTAGIVAMEACKKANIKADSSVLIYGASGGVGQFAVEIAKAMGANVTAVCSTRNVEMVYSIGADTVIDYKKKKIESCNMRFDAILGVNGDNSLHTYKELLNLGGSYIAIGGKQATSGLIAPLYALGSGKRMTFVIYASAIKHRHLETLKTLAENGKIKPFVEKIYAQDEMKLAIQNVCQNHAQGKIVISTNF